MDKIINGTRVQLAPHLDRWMQGDRFGYIIEVNTLMPDDNDSLRYRVKLDKSGDKVWLARHGFEVV